MLLLATWTREVGDMSSMSEKNDWWERNLARYFRILEGRHDRCRDPVELQQEISNDAARMVEDRDVFAAKFQQGVDRYTKRMNESLSGSGPLWRPLPSWQSWRKKERKRQRLRARFEGDTKVVDGRIVRGGLIQGGGRVYMTMEERKRRGGSAYMTMEERKQQHSAYRTMSERQRRGKSAFLTMEEKLADVERKTGVSGRRDVRQERKPQGWVPKAAGKLGNEVASARWEAGYREACQESFLYGWEKVGKTLGKVKGGAMYE